MFTWESWVFPRFVSNSRRCSWVPGILVSAAVSAPQAEIIRDNGTPLETYTVEEEMGRRAGTNLFHSFHTFNIEAGKNVTFSGPHGVENIITRVTGGTPSLIEGTLQATIPGADFYFLNPAGITFGPSAKLDMCGSFYAGTAEYLRFGDGARFSATDIAASTFSTAPPTAFGFVAEAPTKIMLDNVDLKVKTGRTLALVAGGVQMRDSRLAASEGRLYLTAVAAPGELALDPVRADLDAFSRLGTLRIEATGSDDPFADPSPELSVTGNGNQGIYLYSGRFFLDNALIEAWPWPQEESTAGGHRPGTGVTVIARDTAELSGTGRISISNKSSAPAGAIEIQTEKLEIKDEAALFASTRSTGKAGDIQIKTGAISLSGCGDISSGSLKGGSGGKVKIEADSLTLESGAVLNISVAESAQSNAKLDISVQTLSMRDSSSINAPSYFGGSADAGRVNIEADRILMRDSAKIVSSSHTQGRSGAIEINAKQVDLEGNLQKEGETVKILSEAQGAGAGADIVLRADRLSMSGAHLRSGTEGSGKGGDINVRAAEIRLRADSTISAASTGATQAGGDAGNVHVAGEILEMRDSEILTRAEHAGGGNVAIETGERAVLLNSNVFANAKGIQADDKGGNIRFGAPRFLVLNAGDLISSAVAGNGGDIRIHAEYLLKTPASLLDASSELGIDGEITIAAPEADLGSMLQIPQMNFVGSELTQDPCASRTALDKSRLRFHPYLHTVSCREISANDED